MTCSLSLPARPLPLMPGVLHNSSRIQALLYRRMPADCEYPGKWRKMIPETNGYSLQPSNPAVRNGGSTVPKPFLKWAGGKQDRKSTRVNASHVRTSYGVFGLKKKIGHCGALS